MNVSWLRGRTAFLLSTAFVLICLSSLPYLYAHLSCPADKQFVGLIGWDVPGTYMYFMWQKQAQEGHILFEDRLTPEQHEPFYFNLEWLLLGRLARYSGLSMIAAFQLERCLTIVMACITLYYFVGCFFVDVTQRRAVFLWIVLTSGLGWTLWLVHKVTGQSWPIRVWDIEGVNLFGYLINKPHFVRSLALVCLSYAFLLKGEQTHRIVYFVLSGLTIMLQGFIRPYDLPAAFLILLLFPSILSMRRRKIQWLHLKNYLTAALTASPIFIYYLFLRRSVLREVFQAVSFEAFTPLEMILWLGLPLLIALGGFDGWRNFREWDKPKLFLYIWVTIIGGLIYTYPIVPWGMESAGLCYIVAPILAARLLYGQCIPALLRTDVGRNLSRRLKWEERNWVMAVSLAAIVLCFPSNMVLYGKLFATLATHSRPSHIPEHVAQAFSWLAENASPEDVVLSAPPNGYHLPVDASVTAFSGHGHFTVDYAGKNRLVARFFDVRESDDFRIELLKKYHVSYVFFSDIEREWGGFEPAGARYLKPVYNNAGTAIYQFRQEHN